MITSTLLSTSTIELIQEWHESQQGLDPVLTEAALVHDAIHAYCGLGTTVADEDIVLNIVNLLAGHDCLEIHRDRVEFIIGLLTSDVLIELSVACATYFA